MTKKGIKGKVFVALSGGVDSSVAAALLKKAGYDVTGVFIKVWSLDFARDRQLAECTWREERRDAMRVAAKLGISFLTFDLEKEYKRDVVDYMLREYKAGRTPNPDVMCNKYVKFGAFYRKARKLGADFIATGHYARIASVADGRGLDAEGRGKMKTLQPTTYNLFTARDSEKDQSYFLWTLNQEILARTLFPIGDYKKSEVRALAKKFGLFTFEKKDSQGLCFVGKLDMKEFLSCYIKPKRGDVLNENGEKIGFHMGAPFFALGERHGFTVTQKSSHDKSLYVVAKDVARNTITVAPRPKLAGEKANSVVISDTNWIGDRPVLGRRYQAQARYHAEPVPVKIEKILPGRAVVSLGRTTEPVVPGQSLVIYNKDVCLGGGIIG